MTSVVLFVAARRKVVDPGRWRGGGGLKARANRERGQVLTVLIKIAALGNPSRSLGEGIE